ncbi:MAG: DUF2752 domain-containing protein [Sedimentisphaerales bacterium]|nr:DUF2752 domain-containing protein [Sedimentisphaerales bacterium]
MQTSQQINKTKFSSHASSRQRLIAAAICLAVVSFFSVFALIGHSNIDLGKWLGYCGFKQNYGLPCPTCGMTTATLAFSQGKIFKAFYIQPACALLCCLLVFIAIVAFITAVFGKHFRFVEHFFNEVKIRYIILALIIIIAAGWAVTLSRAFAIKHSHL